MMRQLFRTTAKQEQIYFKRLKKNCRTEATGERTTLQVPKHVRAWHWTAENGKTCLNIKYGAKLLPLNKNGMTAVELESEADLLAALETIKQAVEAGELDAQIEAVSGAVKSGFKK